MIQEYGCINKINDISAATKLVPNKSLVTCLLFHGQIYKLSYLQNLLFMNFRQKVKNNNKERSLKNLNSLISTPYNHCCMLLCHQWSVIRFKSLFIQWSYNCIFMNIYEIEKKRENHVKQSGGGELREVVYNQTLHP